MSKKAILLPSLFLQDLQHVIVVPFLMLRVKFLAQKVRCCILNILR